MNLGEFQQHVVAVLRHQFRERSFTVPDDPHLIFSGDAQIGLQNLYADCCRLTLSERELDELIIEHFRRVFAELDQRANAQPLPWETVRPRLRLQLMPAAFRQRLPLVTYPLLDDVMIGLVIDSDSGYSYVREEEARAWGQSLVDLYEMAVDNLTRASADLTMTFAPPPDGLIGVESKDGYDAARILLPAIRQLAAEKLGEPFYAGVPNRDFLIMWPTANSAPFQNSVRAQIAMDVSQQSHPLTATILSVTREKIAPAN